MSRVLIIGAGGVGGVVVHKCAQQPETFSEICLASRTLSRCEAIAKQLPRPIRTAKVDADDVPRLCALIRSFEPELVVNVALPYQDLHIMDACLETKTDYLDTANYEPPEEAKFEYKWQWAYRERFEQAGIMALLGSGFDPGVTNVFCAYAQEKLFDEIHMIDIVDCNAGSHGKAFATNFNPEINIREITQPGRYWEKGEWKSTEPLSVHQEFDFPEVGPRRAYLMYHEELESLVRNIRGLERIRFWMTFSEQYLTHLRVLENIGMTRIDPVSYEGHPVHRWPKATRARRASAVSSKGFPRASRGRCSSTTYAITPSATARSRRRPCRTRPGYPRPWAPRSSTRRRRFSPRPTWS